MDTARQLIVGFFKRLVVLLVSFVSMELFFPWFDRTLNLLRFGEPSLDTERGIEMILFYFFHFLSVSRLLGMEFEHQHFTLHFFGSGIIRYLYLVYGRAYVRHFQIVFLQASTDFWRFCTGLEGKTIGMGGVLVGSTIIMVLIRLDKKRSLVRRRVLCEEKREVFY